MVEGRREGRGQRFPMKMGVKGHDGGEEEERGWG